MEGEPSFIPEEYETRDFPGNSYGRVLHFGIREHGMGAILNGIALHGGTRPYGGTFLVFSDYMRPSARLAAMMGAPVTYVWTHDSIGLGEDGPTHQPVEQLWALRAIPGLDVVRPGDANETSVAWRTILERAHPAALCLTRQPLPVLDRSAGAGPADGRGLASAEGVARGGYVLADPPARSAGQGEQGGPDVLLIATGSEVQHALAARDILAGEGIGARVVSMPCLEWFAEQDASYQTGVLPPGVRARVCVEAGISLGWHAIAGDAGEHVSLEHFGASAAYQTLYEKFGITAERVAEAARSSIAKARAGAGGPGPVAATGPWGPRSPAGEPEASPADGTGVPARDAASPQGETVE
jgi:transketolase